ncbi:hypothetical protein K432DRAFT_349573 [Lepidopterella palustris CBS 459.81]|uniref:DUF8004 domain-containing protein n=1 Tax=Lepidopterella palustris CBS 459.81 TaxID=1314670 RepID=A0A8E2EDV9_9PEZI|nr:hypothetical protein K432DRAFT_349573 [Lepidopterella palustris CBS 459.81]
MAMDSQTSRVPNLIDRPQVPSRSSSLICVSRSDSCIDEKSSCSSSPAQGKANSKGQTSALTREPPHLPPKDQIHIRFSNPATFSKAAAVPNFSRVLPAANDPPMALRTNKRSASCAGTMRNPTRQAKVKRWDGENRTVGNWDGLRRDSELWFEDGDCVVHLYARGQSRRGPSFRVPFKVLQKSNCGAMFSLCFAQMSPSTPGCPPQPSSLSETIAPDSTQNICELYIPAPDESSREASFQWHLTTRNFFAFVFRKPLVGSCLGKSLIDLQERMHLFRSGQINNHEDFLAYADDAGYRSFVDCPDYALAMLYYSEHYQLRELWVDAFAHCVGMNERLCLSTEFEPVSRVTKALITRAYLEMDLHLGRVAAALSNFLEDDLSTSYLGVGQGARTHLDRFRSFLYAFYVEKFGYWPPPEGSSFSKSLYRSMYFDFRSLYDYLVDMESTDSIQLQKPASGGICVLQNVQAFDKRHNYAPLPHPLPRLPEVLEPHNRTQSQRALVAFKLGSKYAKTDRYMTTRAALTAATNTNDISVTSCPLVAAYMRFERECAVKHREEKVSIADARKVRWLLIYGVLQMLVSAIRAPKEVRDTEGSTYPLCCLVAGTPPWTIGAKALTAPGTASINSLEVSGYPDVQKPSTPPMPITTIHPDCETSDYFTQTNGSLDAHCSLQHQLSVEVPATLRISSPILRTPSNSMRSFKGLSFSSFSTRRSSTVIKAPSRPFCEIIVHGYGNGLNETIIDPPSSSASPLSGSPRPSNSVPVPTKETSPTTEAEQFQSADPTNARSLSHRPPTLELRCETIPEAERTPTLESFQIENLYEPSTPDSANESSGSPASVPLTPIWSSRANSTSSASSAGVVEGSALDGGVLGGLVCIDSPSSKYSSYANSPAVNRRGTFHFSFSDTAGESHPGLELSSTISESEIGLAIAPPEEFHRKEENSKFLISKSFSAESFMPTKKDGRPMDMYAAMNMLTSDTPSLAISRGCFLDDGEVDEEDVAPAPVVKMPTLPVVDVAEKPRKKEKRMSLRLIRRGRSSS